MTVTVISLDLRAPAKSAVVTTGVAAGDFIGTLIPNGKCALVVDEAVYADISNLQSLLFMVAFRDLAIRLTEKWDAYNLITTGTAAIARKLRDDSKDKIDVAAAKATIASTTYTTALNGKSLAVVATFPGVNANGLVDTCFERLINIALAKLIK